MIQKKAYKAIAGACARTVLLLCMLFSMQGVWADNYLQNPNNFTAIVQGIDKIRFTLPTQYDGNYNEGIRIGYIKVSVDGSSKQDFLEWGLGNGYNDLTSDDESGKITIKSQYDGQFQLVGKIKGGFRYLVKNQETTYTVGSNDDNSDHFRTEVEWTVPRELRGKRFTFYLWCKSEDALNSWYIPDGNSDQTSYYTMATWDCPAAAAVSLTVNEPMLSYNIDLAGTLMFSYVVQAKEIRGTGAVIHYTDAETGASYTKTLSTKLADFAFLPADRPWKDIYISADVKDSEGKNASVESVKMSSNMLHFPKNLQAKLQPNGAVNLSWTVNNADWTDFDNSDYFEIQRNVNGSTQDNDEGWMTIAMEEQFAKGKDTYTFIDNTLLDRYKNKPVAYRVRRSSTTVWNWKSGSGFSLRVLPAALALPGFMEATVQRTTWNDDEHTVKFNYTPGPKYDSKGRLIVRTESDWQELQQLVNSGKLSYDKAIVTLQDENDWVKFCERVDNVSASLNAVMLGDIDLGNIQKKVGTGTAFKGTFDGLGHTLIVDYDGNEEYMAPFTKVDGATIRNLTVAGQTTSSAKFIGGLVGLMSGKCVIERCDVVADITSKVDGDGSNGGLIGRLTTNTKLTISNSAFSGAIRGDKCYANGGFIGWSDNSCEIQLTNCLFNPTHLPSNRTNCATFARRSSGATMTLNNCYFTRVFEYYEANGKNYYIIHTSADWQDFKELIEKSNRGTDFNAILASDISVSEMLGSEEKPFYGIFDGNEHKLNVNINGGDKAATAPFRYVGTATIKDLRVTGTVSGGIHTGGLIGMTMGSPTVNVDRVWVSTQASTASTHAGGIIGHADRANVYMNDCRFDGQVKTNGSDNSYAGEIIGWANNGGNWRLLRVYDHGWPDAHWRFFCLWYDGNTWQSWGTNIESFTITQHGWSNTDFFNMTNESQVAYTMNQKKASTWWLNDDNVAAPIQYSTQITTIGNSSASMTLEELKNALGSDQWYESDGTLHPVMKNSDENAYCITLWDSRAKLMVYSKMKGENGVTTNVVDLSGSEEALNQHEFTLNLTRKCVDYDFELVVKRGTSPLKIAGSDADTLAYQVTKVEGNDASYKFMDMNEITEVSYEKKQSSVRLQWEVSGGESDYYRVLRRNHSTDANAEWTDTLATNLIQQFYEDKSVLVQHAYDYRVESILQCEGLHISANTLSGAECIPTGRISGYVRMADGTAIAGVTVICEPVNISGASTQTTNTDEAGFFEFSGLPYQGTGTYMISVQGGGYTGPNSTGEVNFNQNSNWTQNFNYYMDNYYIYSGNVYYRDTSIPVPGVSFKLDGSLMHDANQKVIVTDTQGAFSLSIPAGSHTVQAVKDGHFFANDGFLMNPNPVPGKETLYNFNTNVAGVYLWDSTTVVLRGRVVGGDDQGKLPLGGSLSKNNLGDSIKIVLQLEGDNASYLIRKQDDETVKTADYEYTYGQDNRDTTKVHVTRHSMTVRPDKHTGEYLLALHPAKYKVIEISALGYSTLFQQGKVGETLDLSFNITGDTCEYNRIYHAVPTVDVKQFNAGDEPYFGVKKVTASDNIGNKSTINTWYWKKTSETDSIGVYSLGYPVFMCGSPYGWMLQACEKYYYNNNENSTPDIVKLKEGKVTIKNHMISVMDNQELTLDEDGGASYIFKPQNTVTLLTDESALMSVSITLEYDNTFFDIKPLNGQTFQAYVMATMAKPEGRKSVASGIPQLIDVLRDPPGGGSSAYLESGSKLSYTYNADLSGSAGLSFKLIQGNNANIYSGTVVVPSFGVAGTEAGTYIESSKKQIFSIDAITYYSQGWNFSYNFDVSERIQTYNGRKWVGPKADLFMGMTTEVMIEDAIAVRVVPDSIYQIYKSHEGGSFQATDKEGNSATFKVLTGSAKVLVEGVDDTGNPVYLIRDEVMSMGPKLSSTFVHSQHYIENELLPDLIKVRNSLILPLGTSPDYAKQLANSKGYTTYISKVPESDVSFGYTDSYDCYTPDGSLATDSIMSLNQTIEAWLYMLAQNERQKLEVQESDLVKRYDFDGAASIQYSETFSATQTENRSLRYPGINDMGQVTSGLLNVLKTFVEAAKHWNEINGHNAGNKPQEVVNEDDYEVPQVEVKAGGTYLGLSFTPVISLNFTDKSGTSQTHSKKIGFTLSASSKSSLTVDVYRTANEQTLTKEGDGSFANITLDVLDMLRTGKLDSNPTDYLGNSEPVYSSFVYRTRGGVTCEPYEKEHATKWYQPGTVIDVATIPADKPKIWIDEPVVSNVPFDEPARFKLHIANESDYPERASMLFNYFLLASSNPNGAKVYSDGMPVSSQGINMVLYPCRDKDNNIVVFTKELEVYPGQEFDYNDLTVCLYDPDDPDRVFDCKFSAHFVPTAGKVNVSSPGNNWVVNTESPYDGQRQAWYLPVRIDGFDTNYRGFDHIELQYKLSTQGDKDWVNVCSYYADKELMDKASGVTDTIPANGTIIAPFYGETDPIEQYYDIRAVNYCRHGNGFLTRSSEILKGIKDTRLPVAFGTPEPSDGILDIGDDIIVKFSEPIAGNYLRKINNFEMLGTKSSDDVTISTSLSFDGMSFASTQGSRNLSGKSFTVDVMLDPADEPVAMTVFSHGGEEKGLRFGLTADRKLMAIINGQTVESDKPVPFNHVLREVAYALDQSGDDMTIKFYDQCDLIGTKRLTGKYEGASALKIGFNTQGIDMYKGDMLQFRLWNRTMTTNELDAYGRKMLTGYEAGLLDYYPMDEGEGIWSYDRAPGSMDLILIGATWKRPSGLSIALKGDKGLMLRSDRFERSKMHDYTLMFWFRTNDYNTTLFSNGEALRGQDNKLNIGIKNARLYVRSSGFEKLTEAIVSEGAWHHFAMTVSRSQNVANIYIDKYLVNSFAADSLSGIKGDSIALGATFVDKNTQTDVMTGNIDEVGIFSSVLPLNLIKEYSNHTPLPTTSPMMAYLNFELSKKSDDNTQQLVPTGVSLKRYVDGQGIVQERRDVMADDEVVSAMIDRDFYAPMVSTVKLDNINYNFVANGNELYISVNEPDFMVEKSNLYVTVKEVPDLQGNLMASPITLNLYVYRNPLRWNVKRIDKDVNYGEGLAFEATVKNLSGVTQNYSLEDLPVWISASHTSGTIAALDEQVITFTISPYINIGTYNEQISLMGDNKMSEPLPITLRIRGNEPDWAVSDQLKQLNQTMVMVAQVKIDGVVASSKEDVLAVLDENQQTLGVAHIEVNENSNANEALAYLSIYGYTNTDDSTPTLNFLFYKANTGSIYKVVPADSSVYTFQKNSLAGSSDNPVILTDNSLNSVWWIALKKGWNWVTIPVEPANKTVGEFLDGLSKWEIGDRIMTINGTTKQEYSCRENKNAPRGYKWDNEEEIITIKPMQMYNIYSVSDKTVYLEGTHYYNSITAHKDWNRIGYTSPINLPVSQALADYTEKAQEGDVVKSQDGFAIASKGSSGLVWKGTLQYMEAGKGYMLKRQADSEVTFNYPYYIDNNRYSGDDGLKMPRRVNTSTTMNMVATVEGVETEVGDRLVVFMGAERIAEATCDDEQNYYLNIGSNSNNGETLTFVIERNGETIAMTGSHISYAANKVIGTPDQPTAINFTALDQMPHDGKWYTTSGIQLQQKPTRSGLYIYNGKVKTIK